jgi:hypothetical protein
LRAVTVEFIIEFWPLLCSGPVAASVATGFFILRACPVKVFPRSNAGNDFSGQHRTFW